MNLSLKKQMSETQQTILIIAISFILAIIIWRAGDEPKALASGPTIDIQTKIPRGYNLYALDIANIESIDALVDSFALVNIYQVNERKKANLILQKVKLIRSPKNPNYFAILATNADLEVITAFPGPFKVALQNPELPNETIKNKVKPFKRTIIQEDEL